MKEITYNLLTIFLIAVFIISCFKSEEESRKESCAVFDGGNLVLPLKKNVITKALLSTGNSGPKNPNYRLTGIPDGMGIYNVDDKYSSILINHEIGGNSGAVRSHGTKGAFISKWVIDRKSKKIIEGQDLINHLYLFNAEADKYKNIEGNISRLCSGDLPPVSSLSFKDQDGEIGTKEKIFFSGEELSTAKSERFGRAFAHLLDGNSYELPRFGKVAFENVVLNPYPQQLTVAAILDDATNSIHNIPKNDEDIIKIYEKPPSELYFYIGKKQSGNENIIVNAGLTRGDLYGVKVVGVTNEDRLYGFGKDKYEGIAEFELFSFGDVSGDPDGKELQLRSINNGITQFLRIEDGAWSSLNNNEFYFTTTDYFKGNSRLFKLVFNDIKRPELGGRIEIVLNGNKHGIKMLDNITFDPWGRVLMQEDSGKNEHLAKIWMFDTVSKSLVAIAETNPDYFTVDGSKFITIDEETSGIIHAFDSLGEGWYLITVQVNKCHKDSNIVRNGQLAAMYVPRNLNN